MSEATVIVDRIKAHPLWLAGGVVLVLVYFATRGRNTTAATPVTAQVSTGIDPTAAALQQTQMNNTAAMGVAQLQAQQNEAALNAAVAMKVSDNNALVQTTSIAANVANAKTLASIFGTAVGGLTINSDGGAQAADYNGWTTSGVAPGTALVPGGPGWQSWMDPFAHSGNSVPIVSGTPSTGLPTNVTNNQIEELFNNVARAGLGTAPMQTVTMQPPSGTGQSITGTATIDPVFAVWDGHGGAPVITDITLDPSSVYGYTGSVYNPATDNAAHLITSGGASGNGTGTVVAPAPAPTVPVPQFNWDGFNW